MWYNNYFDNKTLIIVDRHSGICLFEQITIIIYIAIYYIPSSN